MDVINDFKERSQPQVGDGKEEVPRDPLPLSSQYYLEYL